MPDAVDHQGDTRTRRLLPQYFLTEGVDIPPDQFVAEVLQYFSRDLQPFRFRELAEVAAKTDSRRVESLCDGRGDRRLAGLDRGCEAEHRRRSGFLPGG